MTNTIKPVQAIGEQILRQKFWYSNMLRDTLQNPRFVSFLKELTEKDFDTFRTSLGGFGFYVHEGKLVTENYNSCSIEGLFSFAASFKIEVVLGGVVQVYYKNTYYDKWLKYSYTDDVLLGTVLWEQIMKIIELLNEEEGR